MTSVAYPSRLGATTRGTTFPDVIINYVDGNATRRIAGFAQIVHNPAELRTVVETLAKQEIPAVFADAVMLRRQELQQINDVWDFPLAASVPNTAPLPWTIIEASEKAALTQNRVEYNIMKTLDFNGRNILRIELPTISLYDTNLQNLQANADPKEQAQHMYLGAWYRDLVPRIIEQIAIYPRSAQHELFCYTGYDIYIHNLIFGNERKAMNDLMSGEDRFELCYDPYRVDPSALGINSFKGMDVYSTYSTTPGPVGNFNVTSAKTMDTQPATLGADGFVDYYQRNDWMDIVEFNDIYRKNAYYEAPIAQNYHARHSIHSRRVIHMGRSIDVPLDILPFGHSLSSAISTAALSGEAGYIRVKIYDDWVTRSYYTVKLSNIAPAHPLVNHLHYREGDAYITKNAAGSDVVNYISNDGEDQLVGWVHQDSVGRFGDSEFKRAGGVVKNGVPEDNAFNRNSVYSQPGSVIGKPVNQMENVISTPIVPNNEANAQGVFTLPGSNSFGTVRSGNSNVTVSAIGGGANGMLGVSDGSVVSGYASGVSFSAVNAGGSSVINSQFQRGALGYAKAMPNVSNAATVDSATLLQSILSDGSILNSPIIQPLAVINATYDQTVRNAIGLRLFQIGFQTLQSISELLTKLPNIYITTEWADADYPVNPTSNLEVSINNDLYHIADIFWFIPRDGWNVESMRVYPPHMINHEAPLINTMVMRTQLDQGRMVYDWDMLNIVNPAYMGLNPLIENIGIMSFAPEIHPNTFPLAYFDPNIAGEIKCTFEMGNNLNQNLIGADRYSVNLRKSTLKVLTCGVNGVVNANLGLYRMVF